MNEALATELLESIAAEQLFILYGAGLSMAPPSSLPSAETVARMCRDRYRSELGSDLDPTLGNDLESIARYFHSNGTFNGLFLAKLVPWSALDHSLPNLGHEAVADFLACKAVAAVVTTNVDRLCEEAARHLGEPDFRATVDEEDLSMPSEHGCLLKVHGCAVRSRPQTIWCAEQIQDPPNGERMQRFGAWLAARLSGRDLLVVGFWSDWAYLSELFAEHLTALGPRSVYLISPDSAAVLSRKAPKLWTWANGPGIRFHHEPTSGEIFLDDLRRLWSGRFVTRLMDSAIQTYESYFGPPLSAPPELGTVFDSRTLYALRRDLTGTPRTAPVRAHTPAERDHIAAALHRRLIEKGASLAAHHYMFGGKSLRVISGRGRLLSSIRADYSSEPPQSPEIDQVVCAGAHEDPSPANIVRGGGAASIVRPGSRANWTTHTPLVSTL